MTNRSRLLLAALVLSSFSFAHAQSVSASATTARSSSPLIAALDSDHNGTLSAREIAAAPATLAALDLNGDGAISLDEWRASSTDGRSRRGVGTVSFNLAHALDANHDGAIQAMEVANAVSSLKQLDLNGDGEVSRGELRPVMVARN
jgi:Ca2+-binding EF-hand superfamily protein